MLTPEERMMIERDAKQFGDDLRRRMRANQEKLLEEFDKKLADFEDDILRRFKNGEFNRKAVLPKNE
jgi:hypothetical protein